MSTTDVKQVVVFQPAEEKVRLQEDATVDRAGTGKNASLSHNSRKRNNSLTRENDVISHHPKKF